MRLFLLILAAALWTAPLQAMSLQDAMTRAYVNNPTLQKQRDALRAVDESVPIAKSAARPTFSGTADINHAYSETAGTDTTYQPRGYGVSASQPVYQGGQIEAGISSAERTVLAQRALLRHAEQDLFLSVAQAYVDVARDQAVLRLNRKNEQVLARERQAARDRLKVGEATKTDTSQADSRHAGAVADRTLAEGQLAASRAAFRRIVGSEPGEIKIPKLELKLPATLDEAVQSARKNSPQVAAARHAEEGARFDIGKAEGALLPRIDLTASAGQDWDISATRRDRITSAVVGAQLTVPLYSGGGNYARVRAAKETASQRRVEVREAMDLARQDAVRAWHDLLTARSTISARKKQIRATSLALTGVREESRVGTRTVLDRLNAEAEAVQAQVALVQAERDEALALFRVKAAVGELNGTSLGLPIDPYDPAAHYNEVEDSLFGLGSETPHAPSLVPAREKAARDTADEQDLPPVPAKSGKEEAKPVPAEAQPAASSKTKPKR